MFKLAEDVDNDLSALWIMLQILFPYFSQKENF